MDNLNVEKSKALIYLIAGIVAIILIVVVVKKVFGGIEGLLEALGLKSDKDESQAIDDVEDGRADSANPNNAFNPSFYKNSPTGSLLLTTAKADSLAKTIWDSVGVFYDDAAQAVAAFKQCKTKSQVSFLSDRFSIKYNRDLFNWLYEKFDTGTQKKALQDIIRYVDALPKYNA